MNIDNLNDIIDNMVQPDSMDSHTGGIDNSEKSFDSSATHDISYFDNLDKAIDDFLENGEIPDNDVDNDGKDDEEFDEKDFGNSDTLDDEVARDNADLTDSLSDTLPDNPFDLDSNDLDKNDIPDNPQLDEELDNVNVDFGDSSEMNDVLENNQEADVLSNTAPDNDALDATDSISTDGVDNNDFTNENYNISDMIDNYENTEYPEINDVDYFNSDSIDTPEENYTEMDFDYMSDYPDNDSNLSDMIDDYASTDYDLIDTSNDYDRFDTVDYDDSDNSPVSISDIIDDGIHNDIDNNMEPLETSDVMSSNTEISNNDFVNDNNSDYVDNNSIDSNDFMDDFTDASMDIDAFL